MKFIFVIVSVITLGCVNTKSVMLETQYVRSDERPTVSITARDKEYKHRTVFQATCTQSTDLCYSEANKMCSAGFDVWDMNDDEETYCYNQCTRLVLFDGVCPKIQPICRTTPEWELVFSCKETDVVESVETRHTITQE